MTVINNATLILKDSQGNEGVVKSFTDNDINKISNAITDVGQVVDPATHMPIEATKTSAGVVQLATATDIENGTAGKVVDAQELNNFAQTLPAANGVTDVSSGDNSNQLVVSRIGGSKTLTIDNVEHASNADEATHATQADTATAANSVAWDNVSGKPSSYTPSSHTHDDRYYTESEIDTKLSGKANSSHTHDDRYYTESEINTKLSGKSDTTHNHNSAYLGITAKAESAKSADSVAWDKVSGKPSSFTPASHTHNYAGSSSAGGAASTALKLETYKQGSTTETYGAQYPIFAQWNDNTNVALKCTGYTVWVDKATTASSVAWANVSNKPTKVSQFTNDSKYITGITKAMVTTALGYTPPTTNTTYSAGTGLALNGTSFNVTLPRVTKDSKSIPGVNKVIFEEYSAGTTYNLPSNHWYHIITMEGSDANYATQLALGMTTTAAYYRCYNSKTWSDWKSIINTNTWNALKGSTTSAAGTAGYAPAPAAGAANRYLRCDGTWQVPPDTNTTYSKLSQFTNDSGYITSSGTAATISQKVNASAKTHTNYSTNGTYVPTMNFLSYWNGAYASSGASNLTYCAQGTIIGSNNIGSQSVNYAKSAGSVAWGNVSGRPDIWIG